MKQTAVEWLAEQMLHPEFHNPYIEQALEMEKEQIMDAYDAGQLHFWPEEFLQRGEYYYNETFNTDKK